MFSSCEPVSVSVLMYMLVFFFCVFDYVFICLSVFRWFLIFILLFPSTPAVVVPTPKPQSPSLQANGARLIEGKSTFKTNAYFRAGVIKPGAYSRSLVKSAKRQNLDCAGCTAVRSLGIDHCHKHDADKYGKGPIKRPRR